MAPLARMLHGELRHAIRQQVDGEHAFLDHRRRRQAGNGRTAPCRRCWRRSRPAPGLVPLALQLPQARSKLLFRYAGQRHPPPAGPRALRPPGCMPGAFPASACAPAGPGGARPSGPTSGPRPPRAPGRGEGSWPTGQRRRPAGSPGPLMSPSAPELRRASRPALRWRDAYQATLGRCLAFAPAGPDPKGRRKPARLTLFGGAFRYLIAAM